MMLGILIALALLGGMGITVGYYYNRLVSLRETSETAWSHVEVQLKRRHDLIPNLVETVQGYMDHEREVLDEVTRARQRAVGASGVEETGESESMLNGALGNLFAVAENYPDLKANQNMLELQEELSDTEDRISSARSHYNESVRRLNTTVKQFPTNLIARTFGFSERAFFELDQPEERRLPEVEF